MTAQATSVNDPAPLPTPEVEAAAKALALHDGWTERNWYTIPTRFSKRYYQTARVALEAADQVLLDRVRTQQARLDAVGQLADGFVSKPRNATDAIEQPGFGRGVRAAGRELRAVLDATEEP